MGAAGLVVVVFALAAVALAAFLFSGRNDSPIRTGPKIEMVFPLQASKADAVYEMLSPSDIHVIVGRNNGEGVHVRGTSREMRAIEQFIDLLSRAGKHPDIDPVAFVERQKSTWTDRERFKLTRKKAKALAKLLAYNDVPVLVSRNGSRVTVEGTEDDIRTVRAIVEILKGREPAAEKHRPTN